MRARALVAAAACLWGMWSLCFRSAERLAPGLSAATETFVVFAVVFVALAPAALRDLLAAPPRSWGTWAELGALGALDALNALCFFSAMQRTTLAVAVLTHYTAPLLVALAAPLVLGERWRARTFGALAAALVGLALLLRPWSMWSAPGPVVDFTGAALGFTSAFFFASTVLLGKRLAGRVTTAELGAWPKLTSVAVLALALPAGALPALADDLRAPGVLILGALAFGALPLVLFYRGLVAVPASQAGVLTLCEPLVAVIVGALVWAQVPSALGVVGGALVLGAAGVIAVTPGGGTLERRR